MSTTRHLTNLQSHVFDFMREFFRKNDQLPPVDYIANEFGRYPNQIHEMLISFQKKGLIERNVVGKWRFTRSQVGAS